MVLKFYIVRLLNSLTKRELQWFRTNVRLFRSDKYKISIVRLQILHLTVKIKVPDVFEGGPSFIPRHSLTKKNVESSTIYWKDLLEQGDDFISQINNYFEYFESL